MSRAICRGTPRTEEAIALQVKGQSLVQALKEHKTLNQLASEHEVHPTQITQRKGWAVRRRCKGFGLSVELAGRRTGDDRAWQRL